MKKIFWLNNDKNDNDNNDLLKKCTLLIKYTYMFY